MSQDQIAVLQDYPNAVLTLRSAFRDHRLGLMLGAGVSRAFKFQGGSPPTWENLVTKLEAELSFDASAEAYKRLSLTQRVDILFRSFLHSKHVDPSQTDADNALKGEWRDLIRKHLYENAPHPDQLLGSHPYLRGLLDLVLKSPLTVTYNFDSYLEESLSSYRRPREHDRSQGQGRPYETVSDASVPQRRQESVLFHINGYLPRSQLETPSDNLVFSDGDFSDQLMMATAGRYATISHHLLNNVYLLLGLSLDDPNLRHMLRSHALTSPGRIHFVVKYLDDPIRVSHLSPLQVSMAESSFELHNLFTLYLSGPQVSALTEMISMDDYPFSDLAEHAHVNTRRVYYISGVPGIGKTTVLRHMGGMLTLDEWMTEPNELLAHPFSALEKADRTSLDRWVAAQFRTKNSFLADDVPEGIVLVERGPLDPLAFEEPDRLGRKAKSYADQVEVDQKPLVPGHVLLLHGDSSVVSRRVAGRQTLTQSSEYLAKLQEHIKGVYGNGPGVSSWRSTEMSIENLVKRVASLRPPRVGLCVWLKLMRR
jgi:SIR2-like domain